MPSRPPLATISAGGHGPPPSRVPASAGRLPLVQAVYQVVDGMNACHLVVNDFYSESFLDDGEDLDQGQRVNVEVVYQDLVAGHPGCWDVGDVFENPAEFGLDIGAGHVAPLLATMVVMVPDSMVITCQVVLQAVTVGCEAATVQYSGQAVRRRPRSHRGASGFLALLAAFALSQFGEAVVLVGLPWFVLETGGDVARMGMVAAAGAIGAGIIGLLAGPFVDRVGFRVAATGSYLIGGAAMGAVAVLHLCHALRFPTLLILTVMACALDGPGGAAVNGLIGMLARSRGMALEAANSLFQGVGHAIYLVGPALGGLLAAATSPLLLLLIDAGGCLLAAMLLLFGVRLRPSARRLRNAPTQTRSPLARYSEDFRSGLGVLRGDQVVRFLLGWGSALAAVSTAVVTVLLTAYSHQVLGSVGAFGGLVTAYSVGALAGATLYGVVGSRLPRRWVFAVGHLVTGLLFALLTGTPGLLVVLVAVAVVGVVTTPTETIGAAVLQERVPVHVFGRVAGVRDTFAAVIRPLVVAVVAAALAGCGLRWSFAMVAGCYLLAVAGMLRCRAIRGLDASRDSPAPSGR